MLRNTLTALSIIVLAIISFAAGFFVRDTAVLRAYFPLASAEEEFGVFWEAMDIIDRSFIGDIPDGKTIAYAAIRGALSSLNDPYTVFLEPVVRDHERESMAGNFGGVGAYLNRQEEGGAIILEPIPGNPAEEAGILSGDALLEVDGVEITPDMSVAEVAAMIKGEKGTTVALTVLHPDADEPETIEVKRDDILIPSVISRLLADDETIGYIKLSRFSGESSNEISEALSSFEEAGVERIILDLRGNGGGLVDAAADIADHFLSDGVILYQQTAGEDERVFNAGRKTMAPDIPLVILVDGSSASASEILAGALQDHDRATIIGGGKTYGKGSVQLVYDLSDGSSVHVTWARWFTPDRHQIDGQGLTPDVLVEITEEAVENGRDQVMEEAINYLNEAK